MKYYTYILFSQKLQRYYIGSTQDVKERLNKHLSSKTGFTSKAKDWNIKYVEEFDTRREAIKRESQIKKWKSSLMIEKLIGA
jgi:putative endonuclease